MLGFMFTLEKRTLMGRTGIFIFCPVFYEFVVAAVKTNLFNIIWPLRSITFDLIPDHTIQYYGTKTNCTPKSIMPQQHTILVGRWAIYGTNYGLPGEMDTSVCVFKGLLWVTLNLFVLMYFSFILIHQNVKPLESS